MPLHGLPSLQEVPSATTVCWHLPETQVSTVHALRSLQSAFVVQAVAGACAGTTISFERGLGWCVAVYAVTEQA
jgi:hypothetical protein